MRKEKGIFFIVGCGRSGTTALTEVLNTCDNGELFIERDPKLCVSARSKYYETLHFPEEFIYKSIIRNINETHNNFQIFGDKNLNYLLFIEELYNLFKCKFLFVIRNGKDVVRSCMDFNRYRAPTYHRYEDSPEFNLTQPEDDFWDYARLRPRPGDNSYDEWKGFSKFEKFSWLWAIYNKILLEKSEKIPKDCFRFIDMTNVSVKEIENIFNFLSLTPFKRDLIEELLFSNINTTVIDKGDPFPNWESWSKEEKDIFDKYAHNMMVKLGYQK